jgi:putative FmdB family regulatory protein
MEKIRKFSDPPLTVCESCGGELDQLVSSPAIQFKGTGWYVTDYAKKSTVSSGSSDSSPASEKKEKAEAKADAQSDATKSKEKDSSKPSEPAKTTASKD